MSSTKLKDSNHEGLKHFDWSKVETVLLDLDGTLPDLHFDNFFWREMLPLHYAKLNKTSLESAKETLYAQIESVSGTISYYCLNYWEEKLGLDIVQLKRNFCEKIALRPNVLQFLNYLRKIDKRVILATNAHRESVELKMDVTDIFSKFDRIYSSHDFGFPKENQAFWETLQTVEPFNRHKTLFIDDNESVLKAADRFGIQFLMGILKPDSQKSNITLDGYDQISNFGDLMGETF